MVPWFVKSHLCSRLHSTLDTTQVQMQVQGIKWHYCPVAEQQVGPIISRAGGQVRPCRCLSDSTGQRQHWPLSDTLRPQTYRLDEQLCARSCIAQSTPGTLTGYQAPKCRAPEIMLSHSGCPVCIPQLGCSRPCKAGAEQSLCEPLSGLCASHVYQATHACRQLARACARILTRTTTCSARSRVHTASLHKQSYEHTAGQGQAGAVISPGASSQSTLRRVQPTMQGQGSAGSHNPHVLSHCALVIP